MNTSNQQFTIPELAAELGVNASSVRGWIDSGLIAPPEVDPVSQQRVYSAGATERIKHWYLERSASGQTRGPGAKERAGSGKGDDRGRGKSK